MRHVELPLAGVDVVELSPPYDHAEVTAYLANLGNGPRSAVGNGRRRRKEAAALTLMSRPEAGAAPCGRVPSSPLLEGRGAEANL